MLPKPDPSAPARNLLASGQHRKIWQVRCLGNQIAIGRAGASHRTKMAGLGAGKWKVHDFRLSAVGFHSEIAHLLGGYLQKNAPFLGLELPL